MTDEKEINALRHYVARLEEDLAMADNETERLRRYSSKQALDIVTLGQEVGRLREALEKIAALDVPPSVMTRYREDEQPSEDDLCPHLLPMSEDCPDCIADYARAALADKEEK